jgi:hypothetical protein
MRTTKTRTAIAALAAALAVAALPATAGAAGYRGTADTTATESTPVEFTERRTPTTDTGVVRTTGGTFVNLEVAPTGDGPADEEECQLFERALNNLNTQMQLHLEDGEGDAAIELSDLSDSVEDQAMDAGCFIVY